MRHTRYINILACSLAFGNMTSDKSMNVQSVHRVPIADTILVDCVCVFCCYSYFSCEFFCFVVARSISLSWSHKI